jgi:hypothetical protein
MTNIRDQVHNHFKVFVHAYDTRTGPGELSAAVSAWVKSSGAAPKSIGVEYLEASKRLVLSVGYRTDEPGYPVEIKTVSLGRVESLDGAGQADLEGRMARAATGVDNIICHELFVTEDHEFLMVFMTHGG